MCVRFSVGDKFAEIHYCRGDNKYAIIKMLYCYTTVGRRMCTFEMT